MIERESQGSQLDELCRELGVQPMAEFRGAEKLELGAGKVPATMYLVEGADRVRFNLKVGHFNDGEVDKTNWLRGALEGSKLIRVPRIIQQEPDRFILFEHIKGLPVSRESFWKRRDLVASSIDVLKEIDEAINREPLATQEIEAGRRWVWQKLSRDWVDPVVKDSELTRGKLFTPEWIEKIQAYAWCHQDRLQDMVRAWRDPNGDHLIYPMDSFEQRVGVVDIDLQPRPRHYMLMRFLAWSLLKIDDPKVDLEAWVNQARRDLGLDGAEFEPTFVLSLTGILYDLATKERDNKNKREIAISVKNIITPILNGRGEQGS